MQYLKGTADKGVILKPDPSEGVTCYVDADFAGGYCNETRHEPTSIYSRAGYVIFYFGYPVLCISKLQSENGLSTVEAEYIALSAAMQVLIPFTDQITEMASVFGDKIHEVNLHCTLFEWCTRTGYKAKV